MENDSDEDIWDIISSTQSTINDDDNIDNNSNIFKPILQNNVYSIIRSSYISFSSFSNNIRNINPIIITNIVTSWPSFTKWKSLEYLTELYNNDLILVLQSKDNLHFFKNELTIHHNLPGNDTMSYIFDNNNNNRNKTLDLLKKSSDNIKLYSRIEFNERFLSDIQLPYHLVLDNNTIKTINPLEFNLPFKKENCTIWTSTKGNITPLHYDLCHGLLCQIKGTKKIVLYHKDDFRSVYPNENIHVNRTASRLINYKLYKSGDKILQELYPKLNDIIPYECILHEGEILYIPPFFWHHVESITSCISVLLPFDMSSDEPVHSCCFY